MLEKGRRVDPYDIKVHKKLGRAYLLTEGDHTDEAFGHFKFVYDNDPEDYVGLLGLG